MKLPHPLSYFAQKILYLWIKTSVLQSPGTQATKDNTATIYVLQSRAWSDLLVLEHECELLNITQPLSSISFPALREWHHVHTVAQAQPLKAWLQHKNKYSKMLNGIHQVLLENPELDVHFIPTVVFWGRPVLKQKHWFRVLFSDTWGFAGRTRRFFTILFNGKNTLLQFSPAISFRDLVNNTASDDVVNNLQQQLSERLTEIKQATLGPDISHRRTLVRKLLENTDILKAIHNRCQQDNISEYKATKIAQNYLNEIVADRSYITIQILQRVLTAFWNKFYSGIDIHNSAQLKQLAISHELVYVPCHRSHIDYLLLSYVIHNEGLAIPYIAAGKNLNMPVIGPILRKAGAFFIRRSFKDNELYSTVMFEYLASQISNNMPIEYFVEGGRSRTGRLLPPKPGMLAMTIRAFLKYKKRPVAFIPVYIGYEKMIEGKAYLAELKGDDKKSETLLGSLRSILNIRGFYGKVSTSFGQPVFLNDILDEQNANWQNQTYDDKKRPHWLKPAVTQTSTLIMQHINESCAVNSINLIATALLAAPNQTMDEGELSRTLDFYSALIKHHHYSDFITLTPHSANKQIQHAENLDLVHRRKHEMGDFIYLDKAHAILLTYYRNNILHLLVLPSLIACCFNNTTSLKKETIKHYIKIAYPFLKTEFFLPWSFSQAEHIIDDILNYLNDCELIVSLNDTNTFGKPAISTEQHAQLNTLAQIVSPVLELYYMIFALLAEHGSNKLSRQRLEELCYLMAQRLSLMYEINSPDFFDKKLIANFINSLIELGYVTINNANKLELSDYALNEGRYARRLLDKNMQYNILQMLRTSASK
ncbi:Glycerol-3-phosphate acyltransferase [hydrothermal vent metagenome]|uniref:Glycerol-3-phosphate acyltransferase n=1 Tax=hydrothermal vent metagenome TaxID=652676 RepID=A0A3B0WFB5_9ZZZZ